VDSLRDRTSITTKPWGAIWMGPRAAVVIVPMGFIAMMVLSPILIWHAPNGRWENGARSFSGCAGIRKGDIIDIAACHIWKASLRVRAKWMLWPLLWRRRARRQTRSPGDFRDVINISSYCLRLRVCSSQLSISCIRSGEHEYLGNSRSGAVADTELSIRRNSGTCTANLHISV
jgi:hypothetical protein